MILKLGIDLSERTRHILLPGYLPLARRLFLVNNGIRGRNH